MTFVRAAVAAVAVALLAVPASAGTLVVAGDSTIAFRFNTGVTSGAPSLAGNVTFAQKLLGGGTTVQIFGGPGVPAYTAQLVAGFTGIGATATSFTTAITPAQLSGADLFVAFFPARAFTPDEATTIRSYLLGGGTVFLAGEATTDTFGNPFGAAQNARLNDLLAGIGSSMRLEVGSFDPSDQFATLAAGEVLAHPLTAGVASFGYGLTTTVAGGSPLLLTNALKPFVSVESIVPEPATWAMLIAGFGIVGFAARRRRLAAA